MQVIGGVSMATLMQQECFKTATTRDPPFMFMALSDGHIEGGQLPAG